MIRPGHVAVAVALIGAIACSSKSSESSSAQSKPAGTPTDPVLVCERVADVCRLDGSRLGVCTAPSAGTSPAACEGRKPCFICMSQH